MKMVSPDSREPLSLSLGLAMHRQYIRNGDMRNINWEEYR